MKSQIVCLVATLLMAGLAGCLGDADSDASAGKGATSAHGALRAMAPAGCSDAPPPLTHGLDGGPSVSAAGALACAYGIGRPGGEPTIGITSDGTVWVYPTTGVTDDALTVGRGPMFSQDEGATWDRSLIDAAGVPVRRISLDPYLYLDPTTDRIYVDDLTTTNCSALAWSDDLGASWTHSVAGCLVTDHQTLFAGPPATSMTVGYPNILYRCAITGGALAGASTMIACQRSLDGGLSWLAPGAPAFIFPPSILAPFGLPGCTGGNGHGVVDPTGRVYLPRGHCGQPWLAISDDEGLTWQSVQVADNGMHAQGGAVGHDAGVAVDAAGTVHFVWVAADNRPYHAFSTDGGATWSTPRDIAPAGLVEASQPELTAGGAGKVAWVFMGTWDERTDDAVQDWYGFIGASLDIDSAAPTVWTGQVTSDDDRYVRGVCGAVRCSAGSGDFFDVRIAPDGTPWGVFTDDCQGPCEMDDGAPTDDREVVAVRLFGLASLWDEADPNGPYPDA